MTETIVQYAPAVLALVAAGLFAGLTAGMFGIGGGIVIVPALFFLFRALGYEDTAMHVAVSTSLATIIATSIRSVMAHHRRGAVDWAIIRGWAPWIMAGAAGGMAVSGLIPPQGLTLFFGAMGVLLAIQLFFGDPAWRVASAMPTGATRAGLGTGVGALSSLMGIGGGTFGVSLMTMCGRPILNAVATAAGWGVAIGLPGTIAAIIVGWGRDGTPPWSLGHVNIPAFVLIALLTALTAPLGAALAHRLNARLLRRLFGVLLAIVAARMIWSALEG